MLILRFKILRFMYKIRNLLIITVLFPNYNLDDLLAFDLYPLF